MLGKDVSGVWRSVRCERVQKEPYYLGTEDNNVAKIFCTIGSDCPR
jgi:hypothetical protein